MRKKIELSQFLTKIEYVTDAVRSAYKIQVMILKRIDRIQASLNAALAKAEEISQSDEYWNYVSARRMGRINTFAIYDEDYNAPDEDWQDNPLTATLVRCSDLTNELQIAKDQYNRYQLLITAFHSFYEQFYIIVKHTH